jgi:hypothetical protein
MATLSAPVTSVSLSRAEDRYLGAVRRVAFHPVAAFLMASGLVSGGVWGGLWGAMIFAFMAFTVVALAARSRGLRGWAARQARAEERQRRAGERVGRLERSGSDRMRQLNELNRLVDQLEDGDAAADVKCFELEDLLDRYVDLASAHARYVEAARRGDFTLTTSFGADADCPDEAHRELRQAVVVRRLKHREGCRQRAVELEWELDTIVELIQLIEQWSLCSNLDAEMREDVQRRLADLDAIEGAHHQLTLTCERPARLRLEIGGDEPTPRGEASVRIKSVR